jgi:nucleoside-diphosphate-sugar epimerase
LIEEAQVAKAVVTGATGFVGSHLVDRLVRQGLGVACLVRATSRLTWLEGLPVETRVAPLEDVPRLADAVADADYVFHVAGLTRARTAETYREANAEGTRRLLDAIQRSEASPRRFVYVSSLAAVGPNPGSEPLDETAEPQPLEGYGASKLAAERLVRQTADELSVAIVRPPAVYGPRDTNLLPLFRSARRYRLAPIVGSAEKEVSFVHAADLAEALWLAASVEAADGETYFAASGTYRFGELLDALEAALEVRLRRIPVPALLARLMGELGELKWTLTGRPQIVCRRKVRDMLQERWTCSWAKAERELGYQPQVGLFEGMAETARWYAEQGWIPPLPQG